jgi:CheY-like chemotaxis protein
MPKKILLADDSITIQKVVELTFSDGDYEVSAVNNGAKAIQKLAELRPDIILSDIIMPEKNGYEVCEYVKSHPEFRNIPVILLTGTFEPFDPDRADKAGCDAVVTKPFESQSLISKVEELIAAAQSAPPAPPPAEPVPEPESFAADTSPWAEEPTPEEAPPPAFPTHDADIFSAPAASEPERTMETPFDSGAFGGETRAFPRMSFEEMEQMAPEPEPITGGETRAFPRMSFEELQQMSVAEPEPTPVAPEPEPEPAWDPFGAVEAADDRSTHAIPPLSLDDIAETVAPFEAPEPPPAAPEPPAAAAEPSPWDQQPAFSAETRAFPRMSFEELQQMATATPEPEPPPPPPSLEPSPWDEPAPMTGGETQAFPRMSFEELQEMAASAPAEEPSPWSEPAASPFEVEPPPLEEQEAPFEPEMTAAVEEPEPLADIVNPQITDDVVTPAPAPAGDLTDDQIDRIARRVVQLMSEQVVRNIAWEVIPDLAEMVVKERIRQLESEA